MGDSNSVRCARQGCAQQLIYVDGILEKRAFGMHEG